jgi:isopenicillin-N epimerase
MTPIVEGVEVDWERRRELFSIDPEVAYLNHGGFGAVPVPVQRAQQRLRAEMEANPTGFFSRGLLDRIAHTRRHAARFVGADPECTALVTNVTAATQVVLNNVQVGPGDEILLTDHGYGATKMAVDWHCGRHGAAARVVSVPLDAGDDEAVATVVAGARPGYTRLVVVDHLSSPTAKILPVARIVAQMRELGIPVFVDAAHAPAMLPLDVAATGADFWAGNMHKWAFAPRPTALLTVAASRREQIEPLIVSWEQPAGYPRAQEFGSTLDYTAWLAAPAGLHLLQTLGLDRVRRHNVELVEYGQRVVAEALRLDPAALPNPAGPAHMRLIPLPPELDDDAATAMRLRLAQEYRCEVAVTQWNGRRGLRIAAQIYNRPSDYDRLAAALARVLGHDLRAA